MINLENEMEQNGEKEVMETMEKEMEQPNSNDGKALGNELTTTVKEGDLKKKKRELLNKKFNQSELKIFWGKKRCEIVLGIPLGHI